MRLAVIVGLLLVVVLFTTLAFFSPVKSLPDILPPATASSCSRATGSLDAKVLPGCSTQLAVQLADYQISFLPSLEAYESFAEIAEGFTVVMILYLVIPEIRAPALLKKRIDLPKTLKVLAVMAGSAAFGVFCVLESLNILYANTGQWYFLNLFNRVPYSPIMAVLGLAVASLCFGFVRAGNGVSKWVMSSVLFGTFFTVAAQVGLFVYDFKEMSFYALRITEDWYIVGHGAWLSQEYIPIGIPLLSNWLVLVVSAGIFVLAALLAFSLPIDPPFWHHLGSKAKTGLAGR